MSENETSGRAKGGLARAAALSDERKKEIAQKGALARWGAQATHRGNFKEDFGIDVECYVLNDQAKTAVISQRGMGAALRLGEGGRSLPRFVAGKIISEAMGVELLKKLDNPLIFKGPSMVGNPPSQPVYRYDVTILIHYCPVKREVESRRAMNNKRFLAMNCGVDLKCKMQFRAIFGGNLPGVVHEQRPDTFFPIDGFSALEHVYPNRRTAWWCEIAGA